MRMFGFLLDFLIEWNALWDNKSRGVRHESDLSKVFLDVWRGEGRGEEKSGVGVGHVGDPWRCCQGGREDTNWELRYTV